MEYRSRLHGRVKRALYQNTFFAIGAIVLISAAVLFFGLKLLITLSLLLGNVRSIGEIPISSETQVILPPTLNPIPQATNSAILDVSGTESEPGTTIDIFLNGQYNTHTLVDSEGTFSISPIRLVNGENRIKAKAKHGSRESAFTPEVIVVFDTTPPPLEIKEPPDGQVVKKTGQVQFVGKTDPEARISLNEFVAIIDNSGNFSYLFPLQEGENSIKVMAQDPAGNQTTNEIKVTFEP